MLARTASTAERKVSAARNAQGLRQYTASFAQGATTTVRTLLKKSVRLDSGCLISVMVANKSTNVP